MGFEHIVEQWTEMYGMLTKSDDYKRKLKEEHEKYGAFRSGEGTEQEIMKKREEHALLHELGES